MRNSKSGRTNSGVDVRRTYELAMFDSIEHHIQNRVTRSHADMGKMYLPFLLEKIDRYQDLQNELYNDHLCPHVFFGDENRRHELYDFNSSRKLLLRLLAPALWPCTALDPLCLRPVDVMCRDPAFIISRCFRSHRWSVGSNYRDLITRINLLRLSRGFLGTFAAFASTAFLGKEGSDPGAVNEIACSSEGGAEEEIEEDTVVVINDTLF